MIELEKNTSIDFVPNTEDDEDQCDSEESLSNVIARVCRKFNKALKKLDIR